jgi:DNA-binding NtrC family response regulator
MKVSVSLGIMIKGVNKMNEKHILICEDHVGMKESLKLILKDDYEVSDCSNSKECLDLLASEQKYNLLLLGMGKGNWDILNTLKEKNHLLKTIIIVNYKDADKAQEAVKVGVVDYVVKPFSSKEILNKVERNL